MERSRLAPSPTGLVHVGTARTALVAWLACRAVGGVLVWRTEDLDGPRALPWAEQAALEDLAWLGLDWDEGPAYDSATGGRAERGAHGPYRQSDREGYYRQALARLDAAGGLYPCQVSRQELAVLASAPHGGMGVVGAAAFPVGLRPAQAPPAGWLRQVHLDAAVRYRVEQAEPVCFEDAVQGRFCQDVGAEVGDFVLRRRDGVWAYQLAVVADDVAQGITQVVRGRDLLDSTPRQILLWQALGATPPAWAHVGLVLNGQGQKINKRDGELTLRALREQGMSAGQLTGLLAHSLGLADSSEPVSAAALVALFRWTAQMGRDWVWPRY